MLNHICIAGRLVKDPELRRTGSGLPVASFSIACDRDYKSDSGERETDFVDIVAWRSTAEFVSKYFAKGRMAVDSGQQSAGGYGGFIPQGQAQTGHPAPPAGYSTARQTFPTAPPLMPLDDEDSCLPF